MSTRGTYQFGNVYLYNHYDNYPEGAAVMLEKMLLQSLKNERKFYPGHYDLTAAAFIRANDSVEITESHDVHGDTEYRYIINDQSVTCLELTRDDKWAVKFYGSIIDFINQYRTVTNYNTGESENWCSEWHQIEIKGQWQTKIEWHCEKTIAFIIHHYAGKLKEWAMTWDKDNFKSNCNTESALDTIKTYRNAYMTQFNKPLDTDKIAA